MKQIENLNVHAFRMEEDFGFHQQVVNLAENLLTQETDKALVAPYIGSLTSFDTALKQSVKNSYTAVVMEKDEQFDRRYVATAGFIRTIMLHPDSDVAEIAAEAYAIWEKYGNITTKPYNEEYGAAYNFLQDIANLGQEKLTISGLMVWYEDLQEAYDRFISARQQQVSEESTKVTGITKDARTACDAAYRLFRQQINAMVVIYGDANYASFIDQVNVIVASAQATLKARSTRSENAKEEESSSTPSTGETEEQ